jgi:hypothetical protein
MKRVVFVIPVLITLGAAQLEGQAARIRGAAVQLDVMMT